MRLHVRVLRAEERLRAVDRELLDLVDELAATVVAAPRISLRVLVRQDGADGFEHRRPREVLRRDQLDLAALTIGLPADQRSDLGIVLREPPDPQTLEVVGGDCHGTMLLAAAARQPAGSALEDDRLREVASPVDARPVASRPAEDEVDAAAARDDEVVARPAEHTIATVPRNEVVGARATREHVVATATDEHISA